MRILSTELSQLKRIAIIKGVFIIYTQGWYQREMGWVSPFSWV